MGQSVLRDGRTPFRNGGTDSRRMSERHRRARIPSKGNRVNIPEPGYGDWLLGVECGDANEPGDVGGSPGKSSLFFVRRALPGIGSAGDRDAVARKAPRFPRCPVHSRRPLKILGRRCDFRAGPYPYPQQVSKVNSLWRWNNVGKGSRQIRSVTSGKGLALRAGLVGLACEAGPEPAGAGRDRQVELGPSPEPSRGPRQLRAAACAGRAQRAGACATPSGAPSASASVQQPT